MACLTTGFFFAMKIKINTYHKKIFADTITPVEVYLKIRDIFPNSLLLENSDYMLAITITHIYALTRLVILKLKTIRLNVNFQEVIMNLKN